MSNTSTEIYREKKKKKIRERKRKYERDILHKLKFIEIFWQSESIKEGSIGVVFESSKLLYVKLKVQKFRKFPRI